ncbi:MAG: hypothetical protein ABIS26_01125 [Candidatus Paceibacterota bacterium]
MLKKYLLLFTLGLLLPTSPVFGAVIQGPFSIETVSRNSYFVITIGGFLILLLSLLVVMNKNSSNTFKITNFVLISVISLFVTFYLAGMTVFTNVRSETGGPVHWHADFKIYECGKEVRLKEPTGLSNRIGRTDLHEHGEKRIHVEGVVVNKTDVSLREFFRVIGGKLGYGELLFPSRDGYNTSLVDGATCENEQPATLQVFLYKTEGKEIRQTKLVDYPNYILSSESKVPPGDCIIFELSPNQKERTDQICDFTSIAVNKGQYSLIK